MLDEIRSWFTVERAYELGLGALRIVIILLLAVIAAKIVRRALRKVTGLMVHRMGKRQEQSLAEVEKRAQTLGAILVATSTVVIWVIALMMAMREAGFDVGPLLAGAGVVGLAIGFGAQNLVRDVITGAFMLLENQLRVGDVVEINGKSGLVERINLRTTVLRALDGTLHIFPNGTISAVSNMTHEFSYYLFDIGVAYKEDTDRVVEVITAVADEMQKEGRHKDDILEPLDVLGVDAFADSAVMIKARIKTLPQRQWSVGREMNRRIKKRFDQLGIEIPFPHRSLYFGEASKAFQARLSGDDEDHEDRQERHDGARQGD